MNFLKVERMNLKNELKEKIWRLKNMDFEDEEFIKREQSDDLLFEAYDEPVKTKAIKLAKQALELNPNNIDAENFITKHETNTIKRLKKYEETLNKEKANLEKENFFNEENVGIFWGLIETRPYMRTKHSYMLTLMELGRYTEAIKQGEELLELCESDNLGVRYLIIGLYTVLERFEECEKIYNKYSDDSTFMLFPLAVMYYKRGDYRKCKKILKEIQENNKYLLDYLIGIKKFTKAKTKDIEINGTYSWGSESEAYFVAKDYKYLLETVPTFVEFIEREI